MRKTFKFKHLAHLIVAPVMAMAFLVPPVSTPQTTASANSVCGDVYDPIPGWLSTRINENKSVYQQVASEKGVPWEVLAAVHYREFNNAVSNPNNGQGIYQLYSSGLYFKPGPVTRSEFIRQTRLAADFIQSKAQSTTYTPLTVQNPRKLKQNETDLDLIKSTLFSYNGRASSYANQATKYGFSSTTHPFEGSPYVMSKFDCQRHAMGLITSDGSNSLTATDTRMGAFTLYARLKGDSYWKKIQPTITYTGLDSPRWMEPRRETRKIDTLTGEFVGRTLSPGQQIYFPTKITIGGQAYLRTEHDTENNNPYAIPYSDLKDIPLVFSPLDTPRWMETTASTQKVTAGTKVASGKTIPAGSHVYLDQSVTYGGETFYRTREDTRSNSSLVIPLSLLKEIDLEINPLPDGSEMQAAVDTRPKNVITDKVVGSTIKKGSIVAVKGTATVDGVMYYKLSDDDPVIGVDSRTLHEVLPKMVKLDSTVTMQATKDTRKVLFSTNKATGSTISKGQKVSFTHKALYKGQWYFQTEYDSNRGLLAGVPQGSLTEVITYQPLDRPRELQLSVSSQKTDLLTGRETGKTYREGLNIFFDTKTYINGTMYLRTSYDSKRGNHLGIPYRILDSAPNVQSAGDIKYQPLDRPRELRLISDLQKTNLLTRNTTGKTYRRGLPVYFDTKVTIGGVMYLRSSHDTAHNNHLGIPYSSLR